MIPRHWEWGSLSPRTINAKLLDIASLEAGPELTSRRFREVNTLALGGTAVTGNSGWIWGPRGPQCFRHTHSKPGTRKRPHPCPGVLPPELPWLNCGGLRGPPSAFHLAPPQPDLPSCSQTSLEPSPAQISAAVSNRPAASWDHRLEARCWHKAQTLIPPAQACAKVPQDPASDGRYLEPRQWSHGLE